MWLGEFAERWLFLIENAVTATSAWDASECHPEPQHRAHVTPPALHTCATTNTAPYDRARRNVGRDWPAHGYTMVGHVRLRSLRRQLERVVAEHVPGDVVELGVWRGGAAMYARAVLMTLGQEAARRRVHLFDAFGTLSGYGPARNYLAVPLRDVKEAFRKFDLLATEVRFHRGLFNVTLPRFVNKSAHKNESGAIAVLRIDGNFYQSYADALHNLWDRVSVGGAVIFDDFSTGPPMQIRRNGGGGGPRAAWEDFRRARALRVHLRAIDQMSSYVIKE